MKKNIREVLKDMPDEPKEKIPTKNYDDYIKNAEPVTVKGDQRNA
jgi:hypothetical protein